MATAKRKTTRARCRVDGCSKQVHARGLCEPHYQDLARNRGPFTPNGDEGSTR